MSARFVIGDTREVLASLPASSVDLVLSSPPFLALRSYLPADHPDKAREIGSEATPGAFIDTLLDVVEACARVLTPHGTLAFELGDTYSGSGGAGGDYAEDGLRGDAPTFSGSAAAARGPRGVRQGHEHRDGGHHFGGFGWPEAKSLCLIPESFRWALVYGRNPFTGRETPRWRARNVVRWCRPNPPVGALGDKFRPATSELVIVCKSAKRWFDLDAVRHEADNHTTTRASRNRGAPGYHTGGDEAPTSSGNPAGAPPLDWWEIPTQGFAGSHYATWPERLVTRPIEAMCPREVCTFCGEPRRRITERSPEYAAAREAIGDFNTAPGGAISGSRSRLVEAAGRDVTCAENITTGWTDCGHDSYRRGVTLDPFAGSGTTLAVAEGLGRDSIGIDLDARNADLARERCGMFLTVEHSVTEVVA